MKELTGIASNSSAIIILDGKIPKIKPNIEIIIIVSEPIYKVGLGGDVEKSRQIETFRFSSSPEGLRKIGKDFIQYADDAEKDLTDAIKGTMATD